ncbi:D-alanyl-D-alanine carboxypeptidase/D-alanyl-D-alanine-endopeptidase (penicillin-binding protein 4) [Novosphingobium sp. SG751A]|uniref:D-alanyl-D-alanine carboxypeptidase/D-alanyl-D-alanine endopeptidase n=1 Tax=Novosphingobium sp. SG751A TaxID=2587000 RepID=UPI0015573853|nr:D-alanyl-D-alanine carboxypeptidase/D-alanyl-D-alanine-endopeptidase [Novosphingobium sp. SG751A]NOW47886.1 D-alanyl-D-alanine carboxypeptidase/D-alanyl-D-alanine-endopeptidase (penicillin-binding protein 4) [Novosphingobium sp. SG751A]
MRLTITGLATLVALCGPACAADLDAQIRAVLAKPAIEGTRWGLRVEDKEGHVIASIAPDERFQPASNTKIFVTTAVFDAMARGSFPNAGNGVRIEEDHGRKNVVIVGRGDAMMKDRSDCEKDCLAALADAVAAGGVKRVGDVIGDDSFMPFERWIISDRIRPGTRTQISALTINDNELTVLANPGDAVGAPGRAALEIAAPDMEIVNQITTGAPDSHAEVMVEMIPGTRQIRLFGSLPLGGKEQRLDFDIDDPADYAAIRLAQLLRERGVKVTGHPRARHAPMGPVDMIPAAITPAAQAPDLSTLTPPDLIEDLTITSKVSQNLHAHLFLKKLALTQGFSPTTPAGRIVLNQTIARAGLPASSHDFYDGSGLSPDNRITPRAMVSYLHWANGQPWAADWRKTLPIGGVDGTLGRRMKNPVLQGKVFAKTGTLLAANALAGYMIAASGRELTFAIYANDRPSGAPSVLPAMDEALALIAAAN